jgi:hypothetical protein
MPAAEPSKNRLKEPSLKRIRSSSGGGNAADGNGHVEGEQ